MRTEVPEPQGDSELQDMNSSSIENSSSPKIEPQFHSPPSETCARAYKESPSEIVTLEREEPPFPPTTERKSRRGPHFDPMRGFVVSAERDVIIPLDQYASWGPRFPFLTDLEATVTGLAVNLLSKSHTHGGWDCAGGWMIKILAEENQKAEQRVNESAARQQRASGVVPMKPASHERRLLESLCAGGAA
jgi:hypothetical protein